MLGLPVHERSTASSLQPQWILKNRIQVFLAILHFADTLPRSVLSQVFYHLGVALMRLDNGNPVDKQFYEYSAKRAYENALMRNPLNLKAAFRFLQCTYLK